MLALVLAGGIVSFLTSGPKSNRPTARKSEFITVTLPPPPPPPPPKIEPPKPKEIEPPKEEEMVEQEPVLEDEPPPEAAPEAPSEDLGTNITGGSGPDMGLSKGGGNGANRIGGTGRKGGSKWGYYASQVQTTIADALRRNASTKSASLSLQVRVWLDANGRITRASLVGSSGNPAIDSAIKNQVLTGLQLPQAPPADMPMPINLRISARKPAL